jgi:hypothetical protein
MLHDPQRCPVDIAHPVSRFRFSSSAGAVKTPVGRLLPHQKREPVMVRLSSLDRQRITDRSCGTPLSRLAARSLLRALAGPVGFPLHGRSRSEMSDSMSRSSDRLRSPGEGPRHARPRHARPTTPGDPDAEVPAAQALPQRPGAAPSRAPDGPVGPRGRGGAHRLYEARQRVARGERRVRRRAGAHAGAHLGGLRRAGRRAGDHRLARCPRPATCSRAGS